MRFNPFKSWKPKKPKANPVEVMAPQMEQMQVGTRYDVQQVEQQDDFKSDAAFWYEIRCLMDACLKAKTMHIATVVMPDGTVKVHEFLLAEGITGDTPLPALYEPDSSTDLKGNNARFLATLKTHKQLLNANNIGNGKLRIGKNFRQSKLVRRYVQRALAKMETQGV